MSFIASIGHLAHKWRKARAHYVTEREISALPFEIQKDIGWGRAADETVGHSTKDRYNLLGRGF